MCTFMQCMEISLPVCSISVPVFKWVRRSKIIHLRLCNRMSISYIDIRLMSDVIETVSIYKNFFRNMKPFVMILIFRRFGGRSWVQGVYYGGSLCSAIKKINLLYYMAGIIYRNVGWKFSDGSWRWIFLPLLYIICKNVTWNCDQRI